MSENPTPAVPAQPAAPAQPKEIKISQAGQGAMRDFRAAFLPDVADDDTGDDEETPAEGEEGAEAKEAAPEGEESEGEDTPAEKEGEDLSTLGDVKGKAIKLKTSDGREVKLPADATIMHKVDGEWREIPLQEALNTTAGELSVKERLEKLAAHEETANRKIAELESKYEANEKLFTDIAALSVSDQPELALAKIAERQGVTPGEVYRKLFNLGLGWAESFKMKGKTMADMENYFNQVDREYLQSKLKERDEADRKKTTLGNLEQLTVAAVAENNLTEDEYLQAARSLLEEKAYAGMKGDKEMVQLTVSRALELKHDAMIQTALEGLPTMAKDSTLIAELKRHTSPRDWTAEEVRELAVQFRKASATKPVSSKSLKSQGTTAKKDQAVQIRRASDLRRRLFGS